MKIRKKFKDKKLHKSKKKEGEMAKRRCKTGYKSSSKKCSRRTPTKKSVRRAKFKWW